MQSNFLFGGDTGVSAEQLKRMRDVAAAIAARGPGAPRNVGEGLSAIGNALAVRGMTRQADQAETALRGDFDAKWQGLMGGAGQPAPTGLPPRGSGRIETMTEGEAVADDAMAALIRLGLKERGLPPHVAEGFVMNAGDESGFRTDINEIAPLVPGSRGGFGLMQWTGPRRVALEQEAARRGVDPSDLNLQLDTIVSEMQGPEARAGRSIMSTMDAPSAAQAIVSDFLRPAPQNLERRMREYGAADIQTLAEVAGSPFANEGQRAVASALLNRQLAAMNPDPMRELELERARLEVEALRNPRQEPGFRRATPEEEAAFGGPGQIGPDNRFYPLQPGPDTVVNVDTGLAARPELLGTQGLVAIPDDTVPQGFRVEPAPGSPIAEERAAAAAKRAETDRQQNLKLGGTLGLINLNIAEIENGGLPVTGPVGAARRTWLGQTLTGSGAVDVQNRTDAITDGAAFAEIQNMRDNSPTGGAVGQLTDAERRAIGNSVTALNTATSQEEYLRAAREYRNLALDMAYGAGMWSIGADGTVTLGGAAPAAQGPVTVDAIRQMDAAALATVDLSTAPIEVVEAWLARQAEVGQ